MRCGTRRGAEKANVIGYCVGGTLVAASLGYLAAKKDERVGAATFFASQVDFEKAGDLKVYVDDEQVKWIESRMAEKGYLSGRRMADAFNLLRSNDLIWSYVVNNYMLGKDAMPFDLLYWNADSTRMPAGRPQFLSARLLSAQPAVAGPHGARQCPHRSEEGDIADLQSGNARGSHRAGGFGLSHRADFRRGDAFRAGGVRAYRRRRQSAGRAEIPVLDE